MGRRYRSWWLQFLAGVFVMASCMLVTTQVEAAGRVQWTKTKVKERDSKSWRLEVAIFLPRPPDVAHVPMKFEFKPVAYFERSMLDGDKLVERKVPLPNSQDLIESVTVGFMDPGQGTIQKRTKFSFKLTRAHGFEAGEYKVTIRDTRNGQVIGTPTKLIFDGENEIIDRRAMVFTGKKKEKKKEDKGEDKAESGAEKAEGEDQGAPTETKASGPAPGSEDAPTEDVEADPPQEIKEKPGGCGCRVVESPGAPGGSLLALAAALGMFWLRRR